MMAERYPVYLNGRAQAVSLVSRDVHSSLFEQVECIIGCAPIS